MKRVSLVKGRFGDIEAVENGRKVAEVCREHSISDSTYFNWKASMAG
ncbi:MAG: transposase [Chloracidobacterium sp.]|nr:transposase [Chloracidobacterium sp.]